VSARGPIIGGLVLILIGAFFLAREVVPGFQLGQVLPVASVVLGVVLVALSFRRRRPG
jgi:uncharacterized membrane protein HdeD (DUF308 family)